jgi:sodium transport system permease protein
LLLVPAVPGFLIAFGSLGDQPWTRIVPIVAQQVLVTDVLAGRSLQLIAVWMTAAFTVIAAVAALAVTARLLVRERVIKGNA